MKNATVWIYIYPGKCTTPSADRIFKAASEYALFYGIFGFFDKIERTDKGKPFFPDVPGISFSISHSGDFWVCSVFTHCIGVDIQELRSCDTAGVAKRFFHTNEYNYLQKPENSSLDSFYDVWTAKESYVKYTGDGISEQFSNFSAIDDNGTFADRINGAYIKYVPFSSEYKLCVCTGILAEEIKIINT